ncbi:unnamed protein product [Acanthoscelides obtectus]|nr:unnamed protein product [Acanthoscelides obtectus]CAK1658244.1 hypothetical protein AOBTE_LOCUS20779 [Acanthoscelides obtectus]
MLIHMTATKFITHQKCIENTRACGSTDYRSYLGCVRSRQKRTIECEEDCEQCQCDSCSYNQCQNSCQSCCSSCCSNYMPCNTHHCCHRTCHAQCDSSDCRLSCRRNCMEQVDRQREHFFHLSSNSNNSSVRSSVANNVTTVIHLNNVVNNTNVIDVPITLESKNIQNVSLHEVEQQAETGDKQTPGRPISVPAHEEHKIISGSAPAVDSMGQKTCCIVVGPKQCTNNYPGYGPPKCFHLRSKQCGDFCITNIVHREEHQVCESLYPGAPNNCRQQIVYIPQPQPRCSYQDDWPYVRCGLRRSPSCAGCYSHYVNKDAKDYLSCPLQCFDEFPQNAPFYRQGPFYQPQYGYESYNRNPYNPLMGGLLSPNSPPGMFYHPITGSSPLSNSPTINASIVSSNSNVGLPTATQMPFSHSDSYIPYLRKRRTDVSENSVDSNTDKGLKS